MRQLFLACILVALAGSGCFGRKKNVDSLFSQPPMVGVVETNTPTPTVTLTTDAPVVQATPVTNEPTKPAPETPAPTTPAPLPTAPAATTAAPTTPAPTTAARAPVPVKTNVIVTPAEGAVGKVARANLSLKYVVLSFPIGQMPADDRRLNVYRKGLKVGEVKVTGPKMDENTIADLVQGTAEIGDDVRER